MQQPLVCFYMHVQELPMQDVVSYCVYLHCIYCLLMG